MANEVLQVASFPWTYLNCSISFSLYNFYPVPFPCWYSDKDFIQVISRLSYVAYYISGKIAPFILALQGLYCFFQIFQKSFICNSGNENNKIMLLAVSQNSGILLAIELVIGCLEVTFLKKIS